MGIINRTNDVSEQKELVVAKVDDTVTGEIYPLYMAPRAQTITDIKNVGAGLSGAPTMSLFLNRFVVGTGAATYALGGALTVSAFGTSGYQTYSLPASGNSLLSLQKGDVIMVKAGAANAALDVNMVELVVQNIQDIKGWF